ncbi:MAG: cytochrome c biogenesis protein CcdA [Planctomycetota bacterium]
MRGWIERWVVSVAVAFGLSPALAQGFGEEGPEVQVSAHVADGDSARVAPGADAVIAVVLDHADKWHTNLNEPVVPPEMDGFVPIPTTIDVLAPEGVTLGPIQWPEPKAVEVDFFYTGNPIDYLTYEGRAVAFVPVRIDASIADGTEISLRLDVTYQACDDQVCLAPTTVERGVRFVVSASAGDAIPTEGDFANFSAATFADAWASDGSGSGGDRPVTDVQTDGSGGGGDKPVEAATDTPKVSFLGFLNFDAGGIGGFVALALVAALGGAILNLTPCVLPVIPIKIMTLSQHAGESRGKALALGGAMALGVIAFWFALGIPAAAVAGFGDPSRIFGYWFVTAPLGVLMIILSLGLMGMFAINLPKAAYMVNPKADNFSGSFLFGVMTGVLGLPCFGFVAGALIPAATTLGASAVIVIFTALGVGMASPYLVLSVFPKLVDKLPRTGPASELVKQVLGLLLIGFGLFFFGTGLRALVATYPFVADVLHIYALSAAVVAAGAWLLWKTLRLTKKPLNLGIFGLAGIFIAFSGVWVSLGSTLNKRQEYQIREAAMAAAGPGAVVPGIWNDYSPELLETALDDGKVTFIDFTADWCINCKVFEAQVLDKDPSRSLLTDPGVAMIKVDLTGSNPAGEQLLDDLKRVGIPTWAVMGPGLAEPVVVDGFTHAAVRAALEAAAGTTVAANP